MNRYLFKEQEIWKQEQLEKVPVCFQILRDYPVIKQEILNLVSDIELPDYPQYQAFGKSIYENTWKAIPLSIFRGEHIELAGKPYMEYVKDSRKRLPILDSIISPLEEADIMRNAFISKLCPGSIINPHYGWSQEFMRIHMGIVTDPECRITVGNITETWEEGKLLAFKDGGPYMHSVKHNGTKDRIVLSIDITLKYLRDYIPGLERF